MSATENAGEIYLAGNQQTVKIVLDRRVYFALVKDLQAAIKTPGSHAAVYQILDSSPEAKTGPRATLPLGKVGSDGRLVELRFSVILEELKQNEAENIG